ncbi:DUF2754 family protein, partial [Salmonella enterica subsp. enterica serovar Enteritidis]|nr:DUF2754 family protein [Salmonella enterica subsp. enterica serovar Enteritidis]
TYGVGLVTWIISFWLASLWGIRNFLNVN